MTARFLLILIYGLLGGLMSSSLIAQNTNKLREVEFKIISATVDPKLSVLYVPKDLSKVKDGKYSGDWQTVRLNIHTAEGPHRVKMGKTLAFYKAENIVANPRTKVQLAAGVKKWLLLMVPKTGGGYSIRPIPDTDVAWRHYGVFNFTGKNIKVEPGGKSRVIPPNKQAVIGSGKDAQWVRISGMIGGKSRILRQTKWRLDANQREFVIYYRMKNGNIGAKHILDHRADKVKE